jgi:hypothetical protein
VRLFIALLGAALLGGVTAGSADSANTPAKPPLVRLHWHPVATGVGVVAADERYLAYATAAGVTLIDQQTGVRTTLPQSACPTAWPLELFLGGPWLAGCPDPQAQQPYTRLYNVPGHYWLTVPGPACGECPGAGCSQCAVVAVGSHWIELRTLPGCPEHCVSGKLLQEISTGKAEPDPVRPRVSFRENLDSPSGTSPLCPPLRYPAVYNGATLQLEPGVLTILGQFALTTFGYGGTDLLERCHSSWRRWLYGQAIGSSQMVLWSDNYWVSPRSPNHGLLLGSLRLFNFYIPRRVDAGAELQGVAVSRRTIYALSASHTLWAANVPTFG